MAVVVGMGARGWLIWGAVAAAAAFVVIKKMIPPTAAELIREEEGLRLTVYTDAAGYRTIGYGHKLQPTESYTSITKDEAEKLLQADIARTTTAIRPGYKRTPTPNQEAAFICFAFNVGATAFLNSTLLKKFNAGDIEGAAAEFGRWNKARINGTLTELPGLTARRADEAALFLTA